MPHFSLYSLIEKEIHQLYSDYLAEKTTYDNKYYSIKEKRSARNTLPQL